MKGNQMRTNQRPHFEIIITKNECRDEWLGEIPFGIFISTWCLFGIDIQRPCRHHGGIFGIILFNREFGVWRPYD